MNVADERCRKSPAPSNGLREIARQLRRLAPDHRKPEAFHETKSDLVAALIAIAAALEGLRQ